MADWIIILVLAALAFYVMSQGEAALKAGNLQESGAWGGICILIVLAIVGCLPGAAPPAAPAMA